MTGNKDLRINIQQERASTTADVIVEAAILVLEENAGDLNGISSKILAQKSGYSVGSLYRYFTDKEHLFSKVWLFFVSRLHQALVAKIDSFPDDGTVQQLMTVILDHYFDNLSKRNPQRMIRIFRLFIKSSPEPENLSKPIDVLIAPLIRAQTRNRSETMRVMDVNEVRVLLRGALAMVRSDLLEQNPYFGTNSHQKLMLDSMVRLFQSNKPQ